MNTNKRIEELNTNLVLQETKIYLCLDEIKSNFQNMDNQSLSDFTKFINHLQYLKNEYNAIHVQLSTFTAYQMTNFPSQKK